MGTRLIIAEKPKAAEKIASALGSITRRKLKGSKVNYYEVYSDKNKIYVASAVGHIYSLNEVKKSNAFPTFDIDWYPSYQVNKNLDYTKDYINTISHLSKESEEVISACDYDVEGSLIGFNAIRFAIKKKLPSYRMKFSALTKTDISHAYSNLEPLDYNNAYAGETRHILDWYWGINLSRALMSAIRKVGMFKVLSIGRVQGPTLDILVKRENEINAFKPIPYWQLYIVKDKVKYYHEKDKFYDEDEVKKAYSETSLSGKVENISKRKIKIEPPAPFDLTSLQIEAYRTYKMSPKEVLSLAQSLYENSYISYPRTSSQKLPKTLNLRGILEKLSKLPISKYQRNAGEILNGPLRPKEGKKDDPAHPAIHPTGVYGSMNDREKKLYDLIVSRFLACFGDYGEKEVTQVRLKMGNEYYIGKGVVITNYGWIKYYKQYYKEEDNLLPKLSRGDEFIAKGKEIESKETQPPKRYTPTSLVKVLEKKNLGTKTTRATIIDTLYKRQYLDAKSIKVTEFGIQVHDILSKYCSEILDENLTRKFELKISGVQEGKVDKSSVLTEAREVLTNILSEFAKNERNIGLDLKAAFRKSELKRNLMGKCPQCGNALIIRKSKAGQYFVGCTNFPKCRNTYSLPVNKVEFVENCKECGAPVVKYRIKRKLIKRCLNPNCKSNK